MQGSNKKYNVMNDLIKDFKEGEYTLREWIIYGVIAPMLLIAVAILASALD